MTELAWPFLKSQNIVFQHLILTAAWNKIISDCVGVKTVQRIVLDRDTSDELP